MDFRHRCQNNGLSAFPILSTNTVVVSAWGFVLPLRYQSRDPRTPLGTNTHPPSFQTKNHHHCYKISTTNSAAVVPRRPRSLCGRPPRSFVRWSFLSDRAWPKSGADGWSGRLSGRANPGTGQCGGVLRWWDTASCQRYNRPTALDGSTPCTVDSLFS